MFEKISRYWVARYGAYPVVWKLHQKTDNDFYWSETSHPNGIIKTIRTSLLRNISQNMMLMTIRFRRIRRIRDRLPLTATALGTYYIGARPKATDMVLLVQAV